MTPSQPEESTGPGEYTRMFGVQAIPPAEGSPALAPVPPSPPEAAAPAKQSSKLPLILGGIVVLLLVIIVVLLIVMRK